MEQKGLKAEEMEKGNDEYGDSYTFSSKFNFVTVDYTPKGQIYTSTIVYIGAMNNVFIEMKLKDAGYTSKNVELEEDDGKKSIKKQWTKKGDRLCFVTAADEEEKMGFLAYGPYKD